MKEWTLVGVPLCVYAVTALAKAETERRERLGFKTEGPPGSSSTVIPEHRYVPWPPFSSVQIGFMLMRDG